MSLAFDRHWRRGREYIALQQFPAARAEWESTRALAPRDIRTMALGARVAWCDGHPYVAGMRAREGAERADSLSSPNAALRDLIEVLWMTGDSRLACDLLGRPIWEQDTEPDGLLWYADWCRRIGDHVRSLAIFDQLVTMRPGDGVLRQGRAQQLQFIGRLNEAESEYEQCLRLLPYRGFAAYCLVRLRHQTRDDRRLALIDAGARSTHQSSPERADFAFARYHVLEDLGETDRAWQALLVANTLACSNAGGAIAAEQASLATFLNQVIAHPPRTTGASGNRPCPIFIVGLPRTGTTVLERALANHSQVVAAGELEDFSRQLFRVTDMMGVGNGARVLDFAEIGRGYLDQAGWRARGRPYFIDKRPANYMLVGMIHTAIPDAKILHLTRDAMDACFSIWRTRFSSGYGNWSYQFGSLAERHNQYRRLMHRWRDAYPDVMLDVAYDKLVRSPAETLRRVFDFCGLPHEEGCEDLTQNHTPTSTLSSAQVRVPIHTHALGQWRRYARQLEPLRSYLESGR